MAKEPVNRHVSLSMGSGSALLTTGMRFSAPPGVKEYHLPSLSGWEERELPCTASGKAIPRRPFTPLAIHTPDGCGAHPPCGLLPLAPVTGNPVPITCYCPCILNLPLSALLPASDPATHPCTAPAAALPSSQPHPEFRCPPCTRPPNAPPPDLVMECCSGGELFNRIAEKGHFTEKAAAEVMRTIVSVVHHCHTMNVIHRDLKPENFLLSSKTKDAVLKVWGRGQGLDKGRGT